MKTHARVIVIGSGAIGCSALDHLTQLGRTDVVLLERVGLTAGSTWHAAGNRPNFSTSWNVIKLQRHPFPHGCPSFHRSSATDQR